MTNRKLVDVIKVRETLVLAECETVQQACRRMWERCIGSALVVNDQKQLTGIFPTATRCVRLLKARMRR